MSYETVDKIFVLDTETTGLFGGPADFVVDVGVCEYDVKTGKIEDIYSSLVGYDVDSWSDNLRQSWIFTHDGATISPDDLRGARPPEEVTTDLGQIIPPEGYATSYNLNFDFAKFLFRPPWGLRCNIAEDIMHAASHVFKSLDSHHSGAISLQKAYSCAFGDSDPARINGPERHLALPDARMAAYLMKYLIYTGRYDVPCKDRV